VEVVVLDVLHPTCVYTFICVEIKKNIETVVFGMFQRYRGRWWNIQGVFEGSLRPDFVLPYSSSLSVLMGL
jgi:hypothetical protein